MICTAEKLALSIFTLKQEYQPIFYGLICYELEVADISNEESGLKYLTIFISLAMSNMEVRGVFAEERMFRTEGPKHPQHLFK